MSEEQSDVGGLWGRSRVLALCAAIFFADASHSVVTPIFPSFSKTIGASVILIGALISASGFSRALFAIPLGGLSDRLGRKFIMIIGMLCFSATPLIYSVTSEPLLLFPARILVGVAMGSTFSIGFIYISERAALQIRSLAQGLYMTSMGLGFTIGTLSGGITAKTWGYSASFYLSSILGLLGLLIILIIWRVDSIKDRVIKKTPTREAMPSLRAVLVDPRILAAGAANFFNSLLFSALIILFPLYGGLIGFDDSQVGLGFTVRGISSTAIRLPTGTATKRLGAIKLMTLGLGISAITVLALPSFDDIMIIGLILGIQGVAYGVYLTAGHAFVAEEAPAAIRGTAIGVYSLFSDISGIISPLILGAIAEIWSIKVAFQIAALICLVGTAIMLILAKQEGSPNSENSSE